jgi:hypothetical protein
MSEENYSRVLKVLLARIEDKNTDNFGVCALVKAVKGLIEVHYQDNCRRITALEAKIKELESAAETE